VAERLMTARDGPPALARTSWARKAVHGHHHPAARCSGAATAPTCARRIRHARGRASIV
jgi:hypothetical protein